VTCPSFGGYSTDADCDQISPRVKAGIKPTQAPDIPPLNAHGCSFFLDQFIHLISPLTTVTESALQQSKRCQASTRQHHVGAALCLRKAEMLPLQIATFPASGSTATTRAPGETLKTYAAVKPDVCDKPVLSKPEYPRTQPVVTAPQSRAFR
jgi:hypothetical protein